MSKGVAPNYNTHTHTHTHTYIHIGYKLEDAMAHVKRCRPVVAPNYNAMKEAIRNGLDH